MEQLRKETKTAGRGFVVYISMAFGNPYEEPWGPEIVADTLVWLKDTGIRTVSLADTVGTATPEAVGALYNAVPPDLSVIAKARGYEQGFPYWLLDMLTQYQEHGVDYITALQQGYEDKPPAGLTVPPRSFYNKYYPGHTIAMPPPLTDERVDYTDGSLSIDCGNRFEEQVTGWAQEMHQFGLRKMHVAVRVHQ